MKENMTFSFDVEIKEEIRRQAKKANVNKSAYITNLVNDRKKEEANVSKMDKK